MSSKNIIIEVNNKVENDVTSGEDEEVYFIVLRPSEEKIDFKKLKFKSDIIPEIIHNKSIPKGNEGNESYLEEIVFKFKKKKNKSKKASNNYVIPYIEGDDEYIISFQLKKILLFMKLNWKKGINI